MTNEERIRNVSALGYSEKEAEFLCLAALHSGYFVRRQFLTFAGQTWGKADSSLTEKLVKHGHAKPLVFRYKRTVFSFCSKPFFAALGEAENRNRRCHEVQTIKNRLIGLDFVLAHRRFEYLATEREKVAYFRERLDVEVNALPAKIYRSPGTKQTTARHFVDKFPLAVDAGEIGRTTVVFTYVDEGTHSTSGFETYLKQYRLLLVRIPAFRLFYVGPFPIHFEDARRLFGRMFRGDESQVPVDPAVTKLLDYFADRNAYERKELDRFDQQRLIQFREDRKRFADAECEDLYRRWQSAGDAGVLRVVAPECTRPSESKIEFGTWLSAFRYELFGTLTSEDWRGA